MPLCPRCQAALSPRATFCANCGTLSQSDIAGEVVQAPDGRPNLKQDETEVPVAVAPKRDFELSWPREDVHVHDGLPPSSASSRRRWPKKTVLAAAVLVTLIALPLVAMAAGVRVVFGGQAADLVAADLDQKTTRKLRASCPTRILSDDQSLACEVTDLETGNVVGSVDVGQRADGSLTVRSYGNVVSAALASPTASAAPSTPPPSPAEILADKNRAARASVASLKKAHSKTLFGKFQPARSASQSPWIVGASGNRALFRVWNDRLSKWRPPFVLLSMRDLEFKRIKSVDVTGDGRTDFILTGTEPSSGFPFGSLLINMGRNAKSVTFTDSDGRYGAVFNLKWTGSELISDYGSWNRISAPGGYSRTRWHPKGHRVLLWVESPP